MKYYQKSFRIQLLLSVKKKEKEKFETNTGWILTFVEVYKIVVKCGLRKA
jgi:hypothetical protein